MDVRSNRPETLYDLMAQVADEIEAAPEFYYQGWWSYPINKSGKRDDFTEACGTAFCRAGHMISIIDACKGITRTPREWDRHNIASRAYSLFRAAGIPDNAANELFDGCAVRGEVGTKEYAEAGAKGVREFMAEHEEKLKAYKLDKEYASAR